MKLAMIFAASVLALAPVALAQTPDASKPAVAPSASLAPPPDAPPPKPQAPGPYQISVIADPALMSHTIYRPADLTPFTGAKRLPIVACRAPSKRRS